MNDVATLIEYVTDKNYEIENLKRQLNIANNKNCKKLNDLYVNKQLISEVIMRVERIPLSVFKNAEAYRDKVLVTLRAISSQIDSNIEIENSSYNEVCYDKENK